MEGTEIVINFAKAAEITKELHSGDYFSLQMNLIDRHYFYL